MTHLLDKCHRATTFRLCASTRRRSQTAGVRSRAAQGQREEKKKKSGKDTSGWAESVSDLLPFCRADLKRGTMAIDVDDGKDTHAVAQVVNTPTHG